MAALWFWHNVYITGVTVLGISGVSFLTGKKNIMFQSSIKLVVIYMHTITHRTSSFFVLYSHTSIPLQKDGIALSVSLAFHMPIIVLKHAKRDLRTLISLRLYVLQKNEATKTIE